MTIQLSHDLEKELRRLAGESGRDLDALVEDAVRHYLEAEAITDLEPNDVAATQMKLASDLTQT
jgi:predicted transcriptional regulator